MLQVAIKKFTLYNFIPSAGIGRTGTLIALDILLDQAAKEEAIDVYKCVTKLREQRTLMVQTLVSNPCYTSNGPGTTVHKI